jgi:hypothetical protein
MEKSKGERVRRRQAVDFVSPLQLEVCQDRVEHGAPAPNLKFATQHTIHDDRLQFTVRLYRGKKLCMRAGITMRRWAGTMTRLEGQVEYLRGGIRYKVLWVLWLLFSMVYCAIIEIVITVLDAAVSKLKPTPDFIVIFGIFALLSLYIMLFLLFARLNDYIEQRELMNGLKRMLSEDAAQEDRV